MISNFAFIRRTALVIFVAVIYFSCRTIQKDYKNFPGIFYCNFANNEFNHIYRLELNADKTFLLTVKVGGASPECKGKWVVYNDSLSLLCDEPEYIYEMLTNGYMNKRTHQLKILNSNRIKYDDVVLKRIK